MEAKHEVKAPLWQSFVMFGGLAVLVGLLVVALAAEAEAFAGVVAGWAIAGIGGMVLHAGFVGAAVNGRSEPKTQPPE